jgi:hypothetical protein
MSKKISDSILEKGWPRNDTNVEDDPYETLAFAYNREMDQLVVANTIENEMEKKNIPRLDDEKKQRAKDNTLGRYHDKFEQGRRRIHNTKVKNG